MGLEGPFLAGKNRSRNAWGVLHDLVNHISKCVEVHVKDHDGDDDDDVDDGDDEDDEGEDEDVRRVIIRLIHGGDDDVG